MVTGIRSKKALISLLLPESFTEAGVALDLSAAALGSYDYITDYFFSGAAVTDYGVIWKLIGTEGTGVNAGNLSASTIKLIGVEAPAKTGNAEAATMPLGLVADSANHSAKTCHLTVWGY